MAGVSVLTVFCTLVLVVTANQVSREASNDDDITLDYYNDFLRNFTSEMYPEPTNPIRCGANLSGPVGRLTSPNWPRRYPYNADCVWRIQTAPGTSIRFTTIAFDLEPGSRDGCTFDYVQVLEGGSALTEKKCGSGTAVNVTSSSNVVLVKFRSDGSVTRRGFILFWESREAECNPPCQNGGRCAGQNRCDCPEGTLGRYCQHLAVCDTPCENGGQCAGTNHCRCPAGTYGRHCQFRCGGNFYGFSGTIQTPGYPGNYPHGANCDWRIQTIPGSTIRLSVPTFDLEPNPRCAFDHFQVFDGVHPLTDKKCGSGLNFTVNSTSNVLLVKFRADNSVSRTGFNASWALDKCPPMLPFRCDASLACDRRLDGCEWNCSSECTDTRTL